MTTTVERKPCVVILSHGRAGRVTTDKFLRKHGYTGDIWVVVDDEDPELSSYKKEFGEKVVVFNKRKEQRLTDQYDNFTQRNTVTYARNASQRIMRERGFTHMLQLDDDYIYFGFRAIQKAAAKTFPALNLDSVFNSFWDFLDESNVKCVAFAQGGDFIGGFNNPQMWGDVKRKAMNSFFIRLDNPVTFQGRMNDDVNTYIVGGNKGEIFLTNPHFYLRQKQTQSNDGGLTDMYLSAGTYVKSMYTVMAQPSSVTVSILGTGDGARMHHKINWRNTVPKILSKKWKKNA